VLIAELNTREKAPLFFGKPPSGYTTQEIRPDVYSINITPDEALREYGLMKLKFKAAYNLVFENELMRKLLRMLPGMNELLLIGKAWYLEQERDRTGRPVWDMIVVDAPATGHGVSLFRLPHVILDAVDKGPLADDTRAIRDMLMDPRQTVLNIVTLAEEMPYNESVDLLRQTREVLKIPTGFLFVNAIWPDVLDSHECDIFDAWRNVAGPSDPLVDAVVRCAGNMMKRRRMQDEYLQRIKAHFPLPTIRIPYIFSEDFRFQAIERIASHVDIEIERKSARL
jgi:anion-transporting  ArsA/GET3 family ATPase